MPDRASPLPLSEPEKSSPPASRRKAPLLDARIERALATTSGHLLIFGWVADDGSGPLNCTLLADDSDPSNAACVLRHARNDVESVQGATLHDFGYAVICKIHTALPSPDTLRFDVDGQECLLDLELERVSERRLIEELFAFLGFFQSHRGREAVLSKFMAEGGRDLIGELVLRSQKTAARVRQVERFGPSRPGPTFITVLFGSIEAAMFQPLLFAKANIAFGEWIYVCNSPEQADALLRLARTASKLHDLPIRVVVLSGNAGFGGANNLAIGMAESTNIVLVNPDVHPLPIWANQLNRAIGADRFGQTLRGGLLFYDDEMLMHGGMYLDEDVFAASDDSDATGSPCRLLRVEHYDKGVPFVAADWTTSHPVPAVTGAVMAFERDSFEKLGGFSSDFVYGHYEDADLCLRWRESIGRVEVDPDIRLVHLEGLGSKTRLPHFHGAAIINRHAFERRNRRFADTSRKQPRKSAS